MGMEPVPKTLYFLNHLMRLMAREDYITFAISSEVSFYLWQPVLEAVLFSFSCHSLHQQITFSTRTLFVDDSRTVRLHLKGPSFPMFWDNGDMLFE
jgi:hypothetical protein